MNDDFLRQFHESPPPEFAGVLYRKISDVRPDKPIGFILAQRKIFNFKRLAVSLAALGLVFGAALISSSTVRANIEAFIRNIGGIAFDETTQFPGPDADWYALPQQTVALTEAQALLPFALSLPTWAPDEYVLQDTVFIVYDHEDTALVMQVVASWQRKTADAPSFINLIGVNPDGYERTYLVGPDGVENVTVNGNPAALVRGTWNPQTQQWEATNRLIELHWRHNEVEYQLTALEGVVSVDELIRMAESMQP